MIIECQSCHARFRLDATKIRGKGARVKCRRCGDSIIVLLEGRKEEASPAVGAGGFLDLGSVVRDSLADPPAGPAQGAATPPPDNLIPFPGPARALDPPSSLLAESPAAGEASSFRGDAGGTDDVDLAFERLLPGAAEPPAPEVPSQAAAEEVASAEGTPPAEPPPDGLAPPEPWRDEVPRGIASAGAVIEPGPGDTPELPPLETHRSRAGDEAPAFHGEGGFLLSDSDTLDFLNEGRRQEEQPASEATRPADISLLLSAVPVDGTAPSLRTPPRAGGPDTVGVADLSSRVEPAPPYEAPADMTIEGNETPLALPPEVPVPPLREAAPPAPRPEARGPSRGEFPDGRAASSTGRIAAAGLAVLLLAGVGYFGFTTAGRKTVETVAPGAAALLGGEPAATRGPAYEVRNVIGYYDTGAGGMRILVIKGQVTNLSPKEKSGIRVFATILDNAEKPLAERAVYAGNVIPGETLRKIGPEGAAKILENRFGEGLANMHVGAGKSVPFMVVFFNAPENIDSYRLEARDGD
ncbi:MAG: family finger-like protein [Deltaproteobacteria bacterium]|jgi:predicted Zn finger-like uncharacterized protein|nr:family finger-like protein [Deltaproteobacteria bacterium]